MRCVTGHVALLFGLLSAAPAFTPNISAQALQAVATTARVADVYVQAKSGVFVFNANSAGQLSLVPRSPFADSGQMEAVRGNALISIGTDYIHTYAIASNGGVGEQIGQINTQDYGGSQCGNTDGAGSILDHTGQYLSVQLYGATTNNGNSYLCSAWQTYKIVSNGSLAFLGDAVNTNQYVYEFSPAAIPLFTVSSNDLFDYGSVVNPDINGVFVGYKRASAGDLVPNSSFSVVNPKPKSGYSAYAPGLMAADSTNHLAAAVTSSPSDGGTGLSQLASYTINNSTGDIQSTNTWASMPSTIANQAMAMSWAGNLLATSGQYGLQLFHFNGAAPATADGAVLQPNVQFNQLAWDKNNHLYALNYSSGELYVYTVTPTSIQEAPGSPYKVPGSYGVQGLIVVPR
jgi:hypothetical protein